MRFDRILLAVLVAAFTFGGMAAAVSPHLTPVLESMGLPTQGLAKVPGPEPVATGMNAPGPVVPYAAPSTDIFTPLLSGDFTAASITKGLVQYYKRTGMDVGARDFDGWEENATISFTYALGDVNGDGVDDLAMNVYCVDPEACNSPKPKGGIPDVTVTEGKDLCQPPYGGNGDPIPNRLYGIDGATGVRLWQRNQSDSPWSLKDYQSYVGHVGDGYGSYLGCPFDYVVGTVPRADRSGNDLLVHRIKVAAVTRGIGDAYGGWDPVPSSASGRDYGGVALIHHEIHLVDRKSGSTIWHYDVDGKYEAQGYPGNGIGANIIHPNGKNAIYYVARAENLTVNPILQVPSTRGAPIVNRSTASALFVQGAGFEARYVEGYPPPGQTQDSPELDSYQPHEWASRLNLTTGSVLWMNRNTFAPAADRSVVPIALPTTPPQPYDSPFGNRTYWSYVPCCFDASGDGVPDLPYLTLEWSNTPSTNAGGPFFLASRLFEFDGATGHPLWSTDLEKGTQRFKHEEFTDTPAFHGSFETLGDADGDGSSDILVHMDYDGENYHHVVSARSGKTGEELWRLDEPRTLFTLVLGDTNGDKGNDVLVFQWQDREFPLKQVYHFVNVTAIPFALHDGADGRTLWSSTLKTFDAPIDVAAMFENFKVNGLPDVNGDHVGDVPVDDPLYLPDIEVVHRYSYINGTSGTPLYHFDGVGTFAYVSYVGDLTGDGVDDFGFLNGDITDLWITMYDGHAGTALWSRRMMTPHVADYRSVLPMIRFAPLLLQDGLRKGTLLNFQLGVSTADGVKTTYALYPQVILFQPNGTTPWALPQIQEQRAKVLVPGEASGARAYHRLVDAVEAPRGSAAAVEFAKVRAPGAFGLYLLSLAATMPIAYLVRRRRKA